MSSETVKCKETVIGIKMFIPECATHFQQYSSGVWAKIIDGEFFVFKVDGENNVPNERTGQWIPTGVKDELGESLNFLPIPFARFISEEVKDGQ